MSEQDDTILLLDFKKLTRIEVTGTSGREYTRWNVRVQPSVQDHGRTLKLFVTAADMRKENHSE